MPAESVMGMLLHQAIDGEAADALVCLYDAWHHADAAEAAEFAGADAMHEPREEGHDAKEPKEVKADSEPESEGAVEESEQPVGINDGSSDSSDDSNTSSTSSDGSEFAVPKTASNSRTPSTIVLASWVRSMPHDQLPHVTRTTYLTHVTCCQHISTFVTHDSRQRPVIAVASVV